MPLTLERPSARPRPAASGSPTRLEPAGPRRRIRVPELVLGVVLIGAGALGAVSWHLGSTATTSVTVLNSDVTAGHVIEEHDLRPASVSLDASVSAQPWIGREQLVGLVAPTPLPAGTVLVPGLLARPPVLAAGEALVGLRLAADAHPFGNLQPGDAVSVVAPKGPDGSGQDGGIVSASAVVWDVEPLPDHEATSLVTLRMPEADAAAVSARAGDVRVVRVVR